MAKALPVGYRYDVTPIAPVPEATTYIPAGALSFGVEYRRLNDQLVDAAFSPELRTEAGIDANRPAAGLDDKGVSIHVCDAESGKEHVRFDNFDGDPHYHYIVPGVYNVVIPFDEVAHGDFLTWAFGRLRTRLPEMLREAGASALADRVDTDGGVEEDALVSVEREVNRAMQLAGAV